MEIEGHKKNQPPGDKSQSVRTGILYDAPHNAVVTDFRRVHNWLEIESLFLPEK
jgi:5'(3')-deoxyribonucleotidase